MLSHSPTAVQTQLEALQPAPRHRKWWRMSSEMAILVLIVVVALEGIFNLCGVGEGEFLQPDPEFGCVHIPGKLVTWRLEGFSRDHLSSTGLRDSEHALGKPPGVYRIALLGDSSTESLQVSLDQTYGKVLERLLNERLCSRMGSPSRGAGNLAIDGSGDDTIPKSGNGAREGARNGAVGGDGNGAREGARNRAVSGDGNGESEGAWSGSVGGGGNWTVSEAAGRAIKRFEVINFGCSSYSTGQELQLYEQCVLKYDPDAVLVLYNRGDSLENVLDQGKGASAEPRPYYYLGKDNQLLLDRLVLDANADKLAKNTFWDFLRVHSRIYGVFSQLNLALNLNEGRYRRLRSWITRLEGSSTRINIERPDYPKQDGLQVTTALLDRLIAETKKHKQLFALLTYPNWTNDPTYEKQLAVLEPFAKSRQVEFLDLSKPFFARPDLVGKFIQYHLSVAGHELAAGEIVGIFEKRLLSPTGHFHVETR
jgi:hypothetical protein